MTEPFVSTEVDRTKSKWVAKVFREFARPKTTLRALFYFALQRSEPDYPICGGFVGEIRVTRPYHENDGEKLAKWAGKAQKVGMIPDCTFLEEEPGEQVFLPEPHYLKPHRLELWINRSAFNPLLWPVCKRHEVVLVSISDLPSRKALEDLFGRAASPTTVLCLSDLSAKSFSFCKNLASSIIDSKPPASPKISVEQVGITPEQVLEMKIPMVPAMKATKEEQKAFKEYLKLFRLSEKRMAELDALEVYYSGGIAAFVDEALSMHSISRI